MAARLVRDNILEELDLDTLPASADVYSRFVRKIVARSVLPRKILIQSSKSDYEIIANKGKVVGFREFAEKAGKWVQYPQPEVGKRALEALTRSAGDALKNGEISLSMLGRRERAALESPAPADNALTSKPSAPSKIVTLSDWKQSASHKNPQARSPVLQHFFASIQSKAKYVYLEDISNGEVQTSGFSSFIDDEIAAELQPLISSWRQAVLPALEHAPQMVSMRAPSGEGSSLVCVVDGRQFLLAEFETRNFGVVVGLWNKATQSK